MTDAVMPSGAPAPAAEPVSAPVAVPAGNAPTQEPATDTPPQTPRIFTQEEVDKIVTKRLSKAERAWERRHQQLLETALTRTAPAPTAAQAPAEDAAPDPSKFNDYTEYLRAVTRYDAKQLLKEQEQQSATARKQAEREQHTAGLREKVQQKLAQGSDKYDDFEEVVYSPDLTVTQVMAEVVAASEIGTDLVYYLAKHPDEAARIGQLPEALAARELGRIEAKLIATPPTAEPSAAPAPLSPIKPAKAGAEKSPSEMTDKEFAAWRKRQIAARH